MIDTSLIWESVFISFCTVIAVQVLYYLFLFTRLAFYKKPDNPQQQEQSLSVIVCARDEARNLLRNLPGILVQQYDTEHEIIVVNDNSVDESRFILDEFKKSFVNLKSIELTQEAKLISGKKFPLSMGIKSAKYDIVLLSDADCVPASEHWIYKMQEGYTEGIEVVLGYGAYNKKPGLLNKIIRFETFHTALQYFSYALAGIPYMGVGRNLSYKREVFLKNKGFSSINQIPSGDDDLFINQVAKKSNTGIVIDPEAHTLSEPKRTWGDWVKQKYRHYTTSRYYLFKHKFLLGLYSMTLFLVYPLLILSIIFYSWEQALIAFAVRFLLQAIVYYKSMKKLNENDLWPYFLFFDIWMFFYTFLFLPAVWKKPRKNWD